MAEDTGRQVCACGHRLDVHMGGGACRTCAVPAKGQRIRQDGRKPCLAWKPQHSRIPVGERKQGTPWVSTFRPRPWPALPDRPVRVCFCWCSHLLSEHFRADDRYEQGSLARAGICWACLEYERTRDVFQNPRGKSLADKDWPCQLFSEDKVKTREYHAAQ